MCFDAVYLIGEDQCREDGRIFSVNGEIISLLTVIH